jgi:succinate dehydrogenase / fumarate reductase cytochrome b subunit
VLDFKNRKARPISYNYMVALQLHWTSEKYDYYWFSSLGFLVLHFIDFWVPEMDKYVEFPPLDEILSELVHRFENPLRTAVYCVSFVLLSLHLQHGFSSSLIRWIQ